MNALKPPSSPTHLAASRRTLSAPYLVNSTPFDISREVRELPTPDTWYQDKWQTERDRVG